MLDDVAAARHYVSVGRGWILVIGLFESLG